MKINLSFDITAKPEFKKEDCWVGWFWRNTPYSYYGPGDPRHQPHIRTDLWICVLPMLPIHFTIIRRGTA